jgi:hypothetical protein
MLKIVIIGAVVVVAAILAFAATRPDTFAVKRTTVIDAPPETLVAMVEDFHQWRAWSPWEKMEPDMARTYEGPERGVGAAYGWTGKKVGAGRMQILKVVPAREVEIRLDFLKPFKTTNTTTFAFAPEGAATRVTWTMTGGVPFVSKVMGLVFDLDKVIGKDFEKGLADMKAEAEKRG